MRFTTDAGMYAVAVLDARHPVTRLIGHGRTLSIREATMSTHLTSRRTCRLCEATQLEMVLQLTPTPPANAFVTVDQLREPQEVFPLEVHMCRICGHVQMLDIVDPRVLFSHYVYVSGTSPVFVEHFRRYSTDVAAMVMATPRSLAVDIGSNDGTLLRFFQQAGLRVLGIDPAQAIAASATANGVETEATFFTEAVARRILQDRGPATIITANNVFAHIDDLHDVTRGVAHLLDRNGIFVCEVSYLLDVLQKTLFDTIYHEHLSYHAVKPLLGFFHRHDLELFHVQRVDSHGGSLRCFVCPKNAGRQQAASVSAAVHEEERHGLFDPQTFRRFAATIGSVKDELTGVLETIATRGETVAGYGAPAKATTLLYHFGLCHALQYIVDDNPLKQNLFSPGAHIPVLPATELAHDRPDYLLILAWNFAQAIIAKCRGFRDDGGRFIVPLPRCEVI